MSLEEIQKLIKKAEHALNAAQQLMENGFSSDAASKAYYVMFYAARALLLSADIDVTKHSAVESVDCTPSRGDTLDDSLVRRKGFRRKSGFNQGEVE